MSEHEHGYVKIADIAVPPEAIDVGAGPGEVIAAEYVCLEDGDRVYGLMVLGNPESVRFLYQLPWGEGIPERAGGQSGMTPL